MRIIVVDTTLSGELIGGAQTFLLKLLNGLTARAHDVHLVCGGAPNSRVADGIMATGVNVNTRTWTNGALVDDVTTEFAGWVSELSPDVYVVSVSPDIGWTVLPHLDPGIATLMIAHSDQKTFYDPLKHYGRFVTRAVGVSEEICRPFVEYSGMPPERIEWIPYGVETADEVSETDEGKAIRLAFVGRLAVEDKRAGDLIKIAKALRGAEIDFRFDVVGDGPLFESFQSELRAEIEAGHVRMHGWIGSKEVISMLRQARVFLLTSESEGFCIALVEAMANGCCPVVTDIPSGNKQLVTDGENGFVVPVGDIPAFVDRIKLLATDGPRLQAMRQAAWYTGRQYSVGRMVDNYVSCFEDAIKDSKENPRTTDPGFPLMPSCTSRYPLWLRRIKARFF